VKHGKSRQILANETLPTISVAVQVSIEKRHALFQERGFIAALTAYDPERPLC
jgi:hypothetical protein